MHQQHYHHQQQIFQSIQITLTRSPFCGFGFAISNETKDDHRHVLIISDVIKNGPADGKLLIDDRIIEVNGHPVVSQMEDFTLKLIRQSTDFLHLTIERLKIPMKNSFPFEYIFDQRTNDEKFGIVLSCEYFLQQVPPNNNENLNIGDEVVRINDIPIEDLSLEEAQRLIDTTKDQLILHTKSRGKEKKKKKKNSSKIFHSNYYPHYFNTSKISSNNRTLKNCEKRCISFMMDSSNIGIRLVGGNKYGLFIGEIQKNSLAEQSGLSVADKIFNVNQFDFTNITREEAVLHLMTMKSCQVTMIVSNSPREYEELLNDVGGDSFYIRSHFSFNPSEEKNHLSIRINDVFHVINTLHNDQVGSWTGRKVNTKESIIGILPNQSRAEQLTNIAVTLDQLMKMRQSSFKGKLKSKLTEKRSKSIQTLNRLKDESLFNKISCWKPIIHSKFHAYERVDLRPVTFIRPVVLFGSLSDIARDRLLDDFPDQFELPDVHIQSSQKRQREMIQLKSIANVIQKNRHCLLEITPSAIEQLNYAQCFPIVIFLKTIDRQQLKEIRHSFGKLYQKSSRFLFDLTERLEMFYSYLFTSIIEIDRTNDWLKQLKNRIDFQQEQSIWMSKDFSNAEEFLKSDEYFLLTKFDSFDEVFREKINRNEPKELKRVASDPLLFSTEQKLTTENSSISVVDVKTFNQTMNYSPNSTALSSDHVHRTEKNEKRLRRIPIEFLSETNQKKKHSSSIEISSNYESMKKNVRDQATMTENDRRSTPDLLYATWNGDSRSNFIRPTILPHRILNEHGSINLGRNSSKMKNPLSSETIFVRPDLLNPSCQEKSQDYRKYPFQDQTISTSSSGSSIRSVKLPNIQEVAETKSSSGDDGYDLIGGSRSLIDSNGGKLFCPSTGISLTIPKGAVREGVEQEVYFEVHQNISNIRQSNPMIICGPPGVQFQQPVKLILPHSNDQDVEQTSLFIDGVHYYSKNHQTTTNNGSNHLNRSNTSFLVNHF